MSNLLAVRETIVYNNCDIRHLARTSIFCFISEVGIGSSSHDFDDEFLDLRNTSKLKHREPTMWVLVWLCL